MGVLSLQSIVAIVSGFIFVTILIPILRRPAERLGLLDYPGERKSHLHAVPLIGGVAMFISFCLGLLIVEEPLRPFVSLVVGMGVLLATGMVDDVMDVTPMAKLVMQLTAAVLMVSWGGVQIQSLGNLLGTGEIRLGEWAIPFTVLCTVFMINAINMADGTDGLAGGITIVALAWLTVVGWFDGAGQSYIAVALLLYAVVVGFLIYNLRTPWRSQASVFMGDAGSMMLGYAIAWLAVYSSQMDSATVYPVTIAWLLVLPVTDLVTSYFRRILRGRSPFVADQEHLHHVLIRAGYSVPSTVALFSLLLLLFGLIGFAGWYLGWPQHYLFLGLVIVFIAHYIFSIRAWQLMKMIKGRDESRP